MSCSAWKHEKDPVWTYALAHNKRISTYFDSGILLRSTSCFHAVVGNFEGELVQPVTTAAVRVTE
jgi:hypothetical protein